MPTTNDLRYRVDLLSQSAEDDYGEPSYVTFASQIWANIEDLSGLELIRAQKVAAKVTHRVTVRYRPGLLANMRIVFEGRTFNVEVVLDQNVRRTIWLTLLCYEMQAR